MKKLVYLALSMLLLCGCTACNRKNTMSKDKEEFLLTESIYLTKGMDELADSEEYRSLMASTDNINQVITQIGSQNYQSPLVVYLLEFPDDILKQMSATLGIESDVLSGVSDNVLEKINYRLNASTFTAILNSSGGSENLVASSMLTWGKSYQQPKDWSKNTVVLLLYDGNYSSMVSFMQSGEGVISASANFVKNNDILEKLKSSKDASSDLEKLIGIKEVGYKAYSYEELKNILQK